MTQWWAAGNARQPQGPQTREAARPDRRVLGTSRAGTGPAPQQGVFIGHTVVIFGTSPNTGLFVYSGSPALGNPPQFAVVAPGVTADPYGNAITSSKILVQGNVITESGGIFRTSATAPLIQLDGPHDAIFVYDASANLTESLTPVATNDGLGHTVYAGIVNYATALNAVVQMLGGTFNFGSPAQIALTSGKQPGSVGLSSVTEGTAQISTGLNGSTDTAALLLLWSKNAGGAGHPFVQLQTVLEMFTPASLPAQQGDAILYDSANAFPHFRAGTLTGDTIDYQAGHAIFRNTTDQTGIGTGATVIAGLSAHLGTGLYNFRGMVTIANPTAGTITPAVGFSGSGGLATANLDVGMEWYDPVAGTFKGAGKVSVLGNSTSPTSGVGAAGLIYVKFDGVINVSTAGTLDVFALGTAVNLTAKAFSRIVHWPDN